MASFKFNLRETRNFKKRNPGTDETTCCQSLSRNYFTKFVDRGKVEIKNNMLALTTEGKELHKSCFDTQQEFRNKTVTDISETDYQTTISTLQKMIANIS